ncbi:hypothetical protein DSO57_1009556 [Entomophthora muscae]|uniref:Uncharacterized protein n=1 Tax=Entomophthora muscae TaxID=34485 RepID=A0ACC2S8V6_9FUNG|nr:hypothetical protein DSO57_1009556 [Entomophthora muscae]
MLFLFFFHLFVAADPCRLVAQERVVRYQEAMACYSSFKLSEEIRDSTMDALRKTLPLVSMDGGVVTLLGAELEVVKNETFGSEFAFHMRLVDVFSKQKMTYDAGCFSSFHFHLPVELVIVEEEGLFVVRVSSVLSGSPTLAKYWRFLRINPSSFQARRVVRINQTDALEYLKGYYGLDTNRAVAHTFLQGGSPTIDPGIFSKRTTAPTEDTIVLEFEDGRKHAFPFLAVAPPGFNDSASFYTNLCLANKETKRHKAEQKETITLVQLTKTKAVLALSSLDASAQWEESITQALLYINKGQVDEVILDLRGSSGNHVCGSYHLIDHFKPQKSKVNFPIFLPNSTIIQKLTAACAFHGLRCRKKPSFVNEMKCKPSSIKNLNPKPPKVRILTNGICTGACAILIHGLVQAGVPGIYFLGAPNLRTPFGKIGTPYSHRQLRVDLSHAKLESEPDAPPQFLTQANLHFTLGATYRPHHTHLELLDHILPGKVVQISDSEPFLFNSLDVWNYILDINMAPEDQSPSLNNRSTPTP